MTDQVDTKQIQWQDLEVAEEPAVIDWREQESSKGFLILTGITSEEFEKALEQYVEEANKRGELYKTIPVIGASEAYEVPRSQHEKIQNLARCYQGGDFAFVTPLCTASRNPLTLAEYERRLNSD